MNPLVLPDDDGIRPAGRPDGCFYCPAKVGEPHGDECVVLNRKVKVRYIYEIEIEVPHHWDASNILYHRNEGTWCADNSLDELGNLVKEEKIVDGFFMGKCLCPSFTCEVVEISDAPPYRKNKAGQVVP